MTGFDDFKLKMILLLAVLIYMTGSNFVPYQVEDEIEFILSWG